jgi:hypothetical protein
LVVECHVRASLLAKGDPVEGNRRETVVLSGNSDGHQPDPGVNPDTGGARQALNGGLPNTVEKRMRV